MTTLASVLGNAQPRDTKPHTAPRSRFRKPVANGLIAHCIKRPPAEWGAARRVTASELRGYDVGWFEEPVSSDDLDGLAAIRNRIPAGIDIAAGEYAYTIGYVRRMLEAHAVDVQQADMTRCGGITAFLQIAALCEAFHLDLSGHCAPALHLHVACAAPRLRHVEWFHDHVRIERMLFDNAPVPRKGLIEPDLSRPGNGLVFKERDAARYAA